ncbi:MAG: hypothetical protein QG659_72 [Patescibacteria group bacterium]|nr:hypothetical protein [Patescibacteria group bacterium]
MKKPNEINEGGSRVAREAAFDLRHEFIDRAKDAIIAYLEEQQSAFDHVAALGYPEGATVNQYITEGFGSMPFDGDTPVPSLSLMLEDRAVAVGLKPANMNRWMIVSMPVEQSVTLDETLDIDEIKNARVKNLAVTYVSAEGMKAHHYVDYAGIRPFISALESGDQVIAGELTDDNQTIEELLQASVEQVDSGLSIASKMFEDFINMSGVPQRVWQVQKGSFQLLAPAVRENV